MHHRFENLVDMQERSCESFASKRAFGTKTDGVFRWSTYREFGADVDAFRGALAMLGVNRGDKVAVISNNRVEWAVAAYAAYGLGAHFVPMYESQHPKDWAYILRDCGAKVLLTSTEEIFERSRKIANEIDAIEHVLCFDIKNESDASYAAALLRGKSSPVPAVQPQPQETAGLIYTSGTTGNPKGVVLSHGNLISNVNAIHQIHTMGQEDVSCSFLPWAHSFGQTCELHTLLSLGAAIGLAESVQTLLDDFLLVRPTLLLAVPRIFNKIYDGLQKRMADETPFKRGMFERGMAVAEERRQLASKGERSLWLEAQYQLFDKLIFSKVRERFGGELQFVISGGAALSKDVAEFIDNIGIEVYEGYGLTETSPIATANTPDARRLGTVGRAIPEVDIFICDEEQKVLPADTDGEIVVVGPNVMQGYYNLPDKTDEVIFELDGLRAFRTGDMGRKSADGFVTITGRFKEQYKLENGKYVVPTPLEEHLKLSGFISQAFIFGDNKRFNVALVVPDFPAIKKWAEGEGISAKDDAALCRDERVHARIGKEIEAYSESFKRYERVRAWALIPDEFTVENNLLTPKMSVKRRNVITRYQAALDDLYT